MDPSSVHLKLRLTGSPRTDSTAESRQGISKTHKADGAVSELRKFYLDLPLSCLCAGSKDIEDDHRPVHDLCVQGVLQVF